MLIADFLVVFVWFFPKHLNQRKSKLQAEIYAVTSWIVNCDEVLTDFKGKAVS